MPLEETEDVVIGFEQVPIEIVDGVVLVVGVVVARPRGQKLVARAEHRRAVGEHQQADEVPHLPAAQRQHLRGAPSSPSQPQFQLRLSSVPSVLPCPLASLCLWL